MKFTLEQVSAMAAMFADVNDSRSADQVRSETYSLFSDVTVFAGKYKEAVTDGFTRSQWQDMRDEYDRWK